MQYMGGKSQIAKAIREHLVSHGATKYVEPFVGGGAVLTTVARDFQFILAADAHTDLIAMYRAIQDGTFTPPETVTEEEYRALKDSDPSPLRTFAAFGASFGGKEWGGYARMTTTTRNGKPRSPEDKPNQSRNSLIKSAKAGMFGDHVEFRAVSVFSLTLPDDLTDTVIYCDPPYEGTTGYKTGPFDTAKAWDLYRSWADRGAHVYVSEYSGPDDLVVDELRPQARMKEASSSRVIERLFYIPPTRVGPDYNTEIYSTPEPATPSEPEPAPEPVAPPWVTEGRERPEPMDEVMAEVLQDGPPLTIRADRWVAPNIHQLPRIDVPDTSAYYPHISAWLATGQAARGGHGITSWRLMGHGWLALSLWGR